MHRMRQRVKGLYWPVEGGFIVLGRVTRRNKQVPTLPHHSIKRNNQVIIYSNYLKLAGAQHYSGLLCNPANNRKIEWSERFVKRQTTKNMQTSFSLCIALSSDVTLGQLPPVSFRQLHHHYYFCPVADQSYPLFGFSLTKCRYFHILSTCYEPV